VLVHWGHDEGACCHAQTVSWSLRLPFSAMFLGKSP